LGVARDALPVAARLLRALPPRLGLDTGLLRLDARRLRLRRGVLGPPAGAARPALLPGAPPAPRVRRLRLHAELRRAARSSADGAVRGAAPAPLLLRRLLRGSLREGRICSLDGFPPDAPQLRSAVQPLPRGVPGRPGLGAQPARAVSRPLQRRGAAAAAH